MENYCDRSGKNLVGDEARGVGTVVGSEGVYGGSSYCELSDCGISVTLEIDDTSGGVIQEIALVWNE